MSSVHIHAGNDARFRDAQIAGRDISLVHRTGVRRRPGRVRRVRPAMALALSLVLLAVLSGALALLAVTVLARAGGG